MRSEMPGVQFERSARLQKPRRQLLDQRAAHARSRTCAGKFLLAAQAQSFVEGHAEHQVTDFQARFSRAKCLFFIRCETSQPFIAHSAIGGGFQFLLAPKCPGWARWLNYIRARPPRGGTPLLIYGILSAIEMPDTNGCWMTPP